MSTTDFLEFVFYTDCRWSSTELWHMWLFVVSVLAAWKVMQFSLYFRWAYITGSVMVLMKAPPPPVSKRVVDDTVQACRSKLVGFCKLFCVFLSWEWLCKGAVSLEIGFVVGFWSPIKLTGQINVNERIKGSLDFQFCVEAWTALGQTVSRHS